MQDSLADQWKRYLEEVHAAQEHLGDYRKTVAACAAWDITIKVLEYMVGGGFPATEEGMSAETVAAIQEYQEALKMLAEFTEKMINGEDPLVIPGSEHDVDLENLHTLQQAYENISRLAGMLGAASPEAMEEHLKDCGAPVSYATYHSAEQYVEHLKGALGMTPSINRLLNDMGKKDLECLNKQFKAYQACVQYSRCRGTAESVCDAKRPPGDWPRIP